MPATADTYGGFYFVVQPDSDPRNQSRNCVCGSHGDDFEWVLVWMWTPALMLRRWRPFGGGWWWGWGGVEGMGGARGASDQAQYQHRLTTNVECDFVSSR